MLVLALDTAAVFCSAALAEDGVILAADSAAIGKGHAEYIAPQIAALMQKAGKDFTAIDRIGVNIGPGSFTGVRVGAAAARALALALEKPAFGISAFAALRAQALAACQSLAAPAVYVAQQAPQGSIYWQYFAADGTAKAPQNSAPAAAAEFIRRQTAENAAESLLIGSGAEAILSLLPPAAAALCHLAGRQPTADIAFFAAAAAAMPADAAAAPAPLYLRAADAKPQTAPLAAGKSQFRAAPKNMPAAKSKKQTL